MIINFQSLKTILLSIGDYIHAMPEDVKLNVLNMILDTSHGIDNIHRHSIYDLILSTYCKYKLIYTCFCIKKNIRLNLKRLKLIILN